MGQNVVGIDIRDLLGNFDGFVETLKILQRPAQPMERIGKLRIGRYRPPVFFDRLLMVPFKNQIESGVVVMLSQLASLFALNLGAGRIVRHRDGLR